MPNQPPLPRVPQPTRTIFDPFNSSATGHQRAANRLSGSTSWRDSRSYKLSHQFRDSTGGGGAEHLSDLVGAGSENFGKDGRKENGDWEAGALGLRESGWQDVRGLISPKDKDSEPKQTEQLCGSPSTQDGEHGLPEKGSNATNSSGKKRGMFSGLTIYLNGSTAPLVGDHKLKHMLAQHGANVSIALGRRTVTHVILGEMRTTSGSAKGLAGSKIQKEIARVGGKGVKYVNVSWVLESIKAGKRLPEAQFSGINLATDRGKSVYSMFQKTSSTASSTSSAVEDANRTDPTP